MNTRTRNDIKRLLKRFAENDFKKFDFYCGEVCNEAVDFMEELFKTLYLTPKWLGPDWLSFYHVELEESPNEKIKNSS